MPTEQTETQTAVQVADNTNTRAASSGQSDNFAEVRQETYGPPASADAAAGEVAPQAAAVRPQLEHKADRGQFYISQMGDTNYSSGLFMCGSTSLYMACRDWNAKGSADITGGQGFAEKPSENERVALARKTGVMDEGQYPGGPALMAEDAERQGLKAKAYDRNVGPNADQATSMAALDAELEAGHSVILNGPNHFIYIAGKTKDGQYIVGDPANPDVPQMTRQDIESRLVNAGRGFTAVWNPDMVAPRKFDNIPGGEAAPPSVDRGDPGGSNFQPTPGGGNGSAFEGGGSRGGGGVPRGSEGYTVPPSSSPDYVGHESEAEKDLYENTNFDKSFTDRLVWAVAGNEGNYSSVNWNDAGYGISVGIRQWNQQAGELPQFMESLWLENPDLFKKLYPELFKLLQQNGMNFEAIRKMKFHDGQNPTALGTEMQEALKTPEMKQFQLDKAREWVVGAMKTGSEAGFKSEFGLACVADAINQAGPGRVKEVLQDKQLQELVRGGDEEKAVERMEALLQRPGGTDRVQKLAQAGMRTDVVPGILPPVTVG